MTVWELRYANINDYAMVVPVDELEVLEGRFSIDGRPKNWTDRPQIQFIDTSRSKNKRPPADVSVMMPGALVLNERARGALV
jgi:hypothetical protein